ncbi:MAG: PAS domain-containing protein [Solirubrobacterales bacterium]
MNGTNSELGGLLDARRLSREILEGVPGGIVLVFDLDLRIVLAEGKELTDRGYVPEDLIGRSLVDVVTPEIWGGDEDPYRAALEGEKVTFDTKRKGFSYAVKVSPLTEDGKIVGAVSVAHSIPSSAGSNRWSANRTRWPAGPNSI